MYSLLSLSSLRLLDGDCGNGLEEFSQKGIRVKNTNLKRASVVKGACGYRMQVRGKVYNAGLSLMPPDLHMSHVSFL